MADRTRPDGEQVADLFLFLKSAVASRLPEGIFPSGPGKGAVATLEFRLTQDFPPAPGTEGLKNPCCGPRSDRSPDAGRSRASGRADGRKTLNAVEKECSKKGASAFGHAENAPGRGVFLWAESAQESPEALLLRFMSRSGGSPNTLLYSRLNCVTLS